MSEEMEVEPVLEAAASEANSINDDNNDNQVPLVRSYLLQIWQASQQLATPPPVARGDDFVMECDNESKVEYEESLEDLNEYIDRIAHNLLSACRLSVLSTGIDNLPEKIYPQSKYDPVPIEDDDEDNDDNKQEEDRDRYYSRRRVDYLRLLLRAMPPISMDVAARICSILLAAASASEPVVTDATMDLEQQQQQQIPLELAQSSFCLFSVWLPAAPHIAPLVSDLFALGSFPCPMESIATTTTTTTTTNDPLPKEYAWLLAEAAHHICYFYCRKRQEQKTLLKWWNWSPIFRYTILDESNGSSAANDNNHSSFRGVITKMATRAMQWHAIRSAAFVLNLAPAVKAKYFRNHNVQEQIVPWVIHPWEIDHEEFVVQKLFRKGKTVIWDKPFPIPTVANVRVFVPLHPFLVELGKGLLFVKHDAIQAAVAESSTATATATTIKSSYHQRLVQTPTTAENLTRIGIAMCHGKCPPPILVCGPMGSGKSSLVREVCRMFAATPHEAIHHDNRLLEIHVDEETDTKTLVGSYTATDIPGEFEWRPGALTRAVRRGKWVLMEDIDTVPLEIQASLVQLLKERLLPLGNGKVEKCHPNFLLFGTLTTHSGVHNQRGRGQSTKRLMNPSLWQRIDVEPLPFTELKHIAIGKHPSLPESIIDSALSIFRAIDRSGRTQEDNVVSSHHSGVWMGRDPSVRDLFKLFSRINSTIAFEKGVNYATESQRTLCLAETVDVFVAACPDRDARQGFVRKIAAPAWGISAELASRYVDTRSPVIQLHPTCTEVGRSRIAVDEMKASNRIQSESFAQTSYSSRLVESLAVSVRQNEATLLVGETGTGKTSIVQYLAKLAGRDLVVQNLSLQTDSTDLLGGYRPLELHHVARRSYQSFVDLFTSTFSRRQNAEFLSYASTALQRRQWKKLSQCFCRAAKMGLDKVKERRSTGATNLSSADVESWKDFTIMAERFEQQRLACDSGLAFVFTEGALVDAIRHGKWVLLDEINLASSETLQRLSGLLDDTTSSLTLTERGDSESLSRHPEFRLFAAMNPATDSGKKDLNPNIRSRFTEIYVNELMDPVELRVIAGRYLSGVLPVGDRPSEHTDVVIAVVDTYLECRRLAGCCLTGGSGQRPRYTLRTLTRALVAARNMVLQQKLSLQRALLEGFSLAFEGPLDEKSLKSVRKAICALCKGLGSKDLDHPGRRPGEKGATYVLLKPFWIKAGPVDQIDWSEETPRNGRSKFILTPTTTINLRRLARAVASGPWPVLLEGPTSAGKTSLIEYLAARCGHRVVRINNHEHTDVQEYTGGFAADSKGSLSFQDGLLVRALRHGDWVILDELNLAPSEVLEALNRLLDDNRELYIPEVNEVVKAHPDFRLFATQNPSGAYGGRKPLSRAFRNRFVEIHVGDIPSSEMVSILHLRCGCPPSHSKQLVSIMEALRQRRSRSGVFLGKDGFMTPRDLLRWAERDAPSKLDLAREGFMLLAERLRTDEEKECVKNEIEKQLKVSIDVESLYYGESSEGRQLLEKAFISESSSTSLAKSIAPTRAILRLVTLVLRCINQREPVLLVGETGCGKTTVVQLLSSVLGSTLHIVNCHAATETSDLLGGLRPVRGRSEIAKEMFGAIRDLGRLLEGKVQERWKSVIIPEVVESCWTGDVTENLSSASFPLDKIAHMMEFARSITLAEKKREDESVERGSKRRKLGFESSQGSGSDSERTDEIATILKRVEDLLHCYFALFEWVDGPLVQSMKRGDMILLDEMSLAEDAVIERLNSVLEPSRTLVLAEKGNPASEEDRIISASQNFQLFATMNPGGDFGKRELSPALRSRFTEIWVPPITSLFDIDMVLEHSLSVYLPLEQLLTAKNCILSYFEWFNDAVCCDPSGPCSGLSLTLRDILTWSRFVVAAFDQNKDLTLNHLLLEGARLMHLDGLGLGTGLSLADVAGTRRLAELFLVSRFGKNEVETSSMDDPVSPALCVSGDRFGGFPFWIPVGPEPIHDTHFNFHARTTALNAQRVLRAMQLPKPVLLEGSPGVGKTALVRALSVASGHRLVRINLSEQTDVADLMGSDLPVPDKDSHGAGRASFKWCDGVLLLAIKRGDWVLLDELNLASQSVLEGLNSCLDHRSSVFIPELGRTFDCPPTFRVFAAQNPLAQGGGRKGLPKSFLNRFTKVYVDALSTDDMEVIASNVFPSVNREYIQKMVAFNNRVHAGVVDQNLLGHQGSSWEFNLRDIFRWCELLYKKGSGHTATHVSDLYVQRFRNRNDRKAIESIYNDIFGCEFSGFASSVMSVEDSEVSICDVAIPRKSSEFGTVESAFAEGRTLFSVSSALVAVARCVEMKWPCLLVGGPSSAKSTLIRTLADVTNTKTIEIALSPSSDVSELVGCFEQVDSMNELRVLVCQLLRHTSEATILTKNKKQLHEISRLFFILQGLVNSENANPMDWSGIGLKLSSLIHGIEGDVDRAAISSLSQRIGKLQGKDSPKSDAAGHFTWKDGVLVEAMINGYWLHLKNANLCPSSVLDRLNPVMEPGGSLLLAEGTTDKKSGSSFHRRIECHPDFRIFLSMDCEYGEVSRAMRNRCVEVSLCGCLNARLKQLDALDGMWLSGLRLEETSKAIFRHVEQKGIDQGHLGFFRAIHTVGEVACSLMQRSPSLDVLETAMDCLEFRLYKDEDVGNDSETPLLPPVSVRDGWSLSHEYSQVLWESRLIRYFVEFDEQNFDSFSSQLLSSWLSFCPKFLSEFLDNFSNIEVDLVSVRDSLLSIYLSKMSGISADARLSFLFHLNGSLRRSVFFLVNIMSQAVFQEPVTMVGSIKPSTWRALARFPSLLRQHVWLTKRKSRKSATNSLARTSILDLAFGASNGQLDQTTFTCTLIPIIFPFFEAFDDWFGELSVLDVGNKSYWDCLYHRDNLWFLLQNTIYGTQAVSGSVCFDVTDFIVQWMWTRKRARLLESELRRISPEMLVTVKKQLLDRAMDAVEGVIYDTTEPIAFDYTMVPKSPLSIIVPRTRQVWAVLRGVRQLSAILSVDRSSGKISSETMNLASLVTSQRELFLADKKLRKEILAALSTVSLASMEGVSFRGLSEVFNSMNGIEKSLRKAISRRDENLMQRLQFIRIDPSISYQRDGGWTFEEMDHMMKKASDAGKAYSVTADHLLQKFASLQLAPLAEVWCEQRELFIIRYLSRMMVKTHHPGQLRAELASIHQALDLFMDIALTYTLWDIDELRPFQTLLWVSEANNVDIGSTVKFIQQCLLVMSCNASKRTWGNSQILLDLLSRDLELPSLLEHPSPELQRQAKSLSLLEGDESVPCSVVFSLLGDMSEHQNTHPFATIENYKARETQSRTLIDLSTRLRTRTNISFPFEIVFLLSDALRMIKKTFSPEVYHRLSGMFDSFDTLGKENLEQMQELAGKSSCRVFQKCFLRVFTPLLLVLGDLCGNTQDTPNSSREISMARIYLGTLRFHLLVPQSPLDPGRRPRSKTSLIDLQLQRLWNHIFASTVQKFCVEGDDGVTSQIDEMVAECNRLTAKKARQQKKIVERPDDVPPFADFFRETREFARNFVDLNPFLDMVEELQDLGGSECKATALLRLKQWQLTARTFHCELLSKYDGYEDIVLPLLGALAMINDGLYNLARSMDSSRAEKSQVKDIVELMMPFPFQPCPFHSLVKHVYSINAKTKRDLARRRVLGFAVLARLQIDLQVTGMNTDVLSYWLELVEAITVGADPMDIPSKSIAVQTEEESNEQEYRKYFPDHQKEFDELIEAQEDEETVSFAVASEHPCNEEDIDSEMTKTSPLDKKDTLLLASLHEFFFGSNIHTISDSRRLRTFELSYSAAYSIYCNQSSGSNNVSEGVSSGFVMALSHSMQESLLKSCLRGRKVWNFQRDSNPQEAIKASHPVEALSSRLVELLMAFPGNAILLAIARVAERVKRFSIYSVPLGKFMAGLELVLKHAQDWEQHASERVRLGCALDEVKVVVSNWRKLELSSWSDLLRSHEVEMTQQAKMHWNRIHAILRGMLNGTKVPIDHQGVDQFNQFDTLPPGWVFKSKAKELPLPRVDMEDACKLFDTFCLSSPIGEFSARLDMISCFAKQVEEEARKSGDDGAAIVLARSMRSIYLYYRQFSTFFERKITELRQPLEEKLRKEVKLAKWDEQTYYALAESTERNHRMLMRILREYDESLQQNVGFLLEVELCRGVRGSSDMQDEACCSIPVNTTFFPLPGIEEAAAPGPLDENIPFPFAWADVSTINVTDSETIRKLGHFGRKMASLLYEKKNSGSRAITGRLEAENFCNAVFERIESLRSEKATRPMKERALVDLFRALRRQGFASTKWTVPLELRQIGQIFQLPQLDPLRLHDGSFMDRMLESSDIYFQRSLSEQTRLRSEIATFGSRHLNSSQLAMAQGFMDHSLMLLIQQRCVLAQTISHCSRLARMLSTTEEVDPELPLFQNSLKTKLHEFQQAHHRSIESVRELKLFMSTSLYHLQGEKAKWARDFVASLDSLVPVTTGRPSPSSDFPIVTNSMLQAARKKAGNLEALRKFIKECRDTSIKLVCLPISAFDGCLDLISKALAFGHDIGPSNPRQEHTRTPQLTENSSKDIALKQFDCAVEKSIQVSLLAIQTLLKDRISVPEQEGEEVSIRKLHVSTTEAWLASDLKRMAECFHAVLLELRYLHDGQTLRIEERACCTRLVIDLSFLYRTAMKIISRRMQEYCGFHRGCAKLQYVLLRVFRVLASKGFCSSEKNDAGEGECGDVSGMNFSDDQEGTGMGEGDGKKDVTDEIENEDQLLGLKGHQNDDKDGPPRNEPHQLDEEEANKGMEMEGDFEGEMYDMPDRTQDNDINDKEDSEEELDREMGDEQNANEEVIDEKMWGDSDDEDDASQGEKFEKNSSVKGDAAADEMMTREEDHPKEQGDAKDEKENDSQGHENGGDDAVDNEETVNQDTEEKYEENQGINVRDEKLSDDLDDQNDSEEQLQINQDLSLDDQSEHEEGVENGEEAEPDINKEDEDEFIGEQQQDPDVSDHAEDEGEEEKADEPQVNSQSAIEGFENESTKEAIPGKDEEAHTELPRQEKQPQAGLGIQSVDGKDTIQDDRNEEAIGEEGNCKEQAEDGCGAEETEFSAQGGNAFGTRQPEASTSVGDDCGERHGQNDMPNPIKNPGDATKFWHRRLNVIKSSEAEDQVETGQDPLVDDNRETNGDFEYVGPNQESTTQALGEVEDSDALRLEDHTEEKEDYLEAANTDSFGERENEQAATRENQKMQQRSASTAPDDAKMDEMEEETETEKYGEDIAEDSDSDDILQANSSHDNLLVGNQVVSDLSQLNMSGEPHSVPAKEQRIIEEEQTTGISTAEATAARMHWAQIQGETHNLSRRLCEKLRLVMEPLVASKLRGDYRTGKRINMKRVIGYIASGYRKDKIWLRRTKPAKRNYRVLVAVDDSESMLKSGAGDMALKAMATLAIGMSQLEIGELGIASFGNDMHLVHPFHQPFTSESGTNVVQHFQFSQQRTRTALCVKSAMVALDTPGDQASMQLVFMISDGRIERDSRVELRRLIREMMERNILLAMIIVEGSQKKDSILNMKEVSFEKGKPKVKGFIEDYPFPYYILLDDMESLPEIMGDALRQWFEMLAQLQSTPV